MNCDASGVLWCAYVEDDVAGEAIYTADGNAGIAQDRATATF